MLKIQGCPSYPACIRAINNLLPWWPQPESGWQETLDSWRSIPTNLNPQHVQFISVNIETNLHFLSFLNTEMEQIVEILPINNNKHLFAHHSQYPGCWGFGGTRSQGISSHDIDLVILEYSSLGTRAVKPHPHPPSTLTPPKSVKYSIMVLMLTMSVGCQQAWY